eukprot:m51a1_g1693 hypothetical protein (340) ;mRNA; f:473862-475610
MSASLPCWLVCGLSVLLCAALARMAGAAGGFEYYQSEHAQMFFPPSVPWKVTRVCFLMALHETGNLSWSPVRGDVSIYPVAVAWNEQIFYPSARSSFVPFVVNATMRPTSTDPSVVLPEWWHGVDVSAATPPFVIYQRSAWVAFWYTSCARVVFAASLNQSLSGAPGVRRDRYYWWSRQEDSSLYDAAKSYAIRVEGEPYLTGWDKCPLSKYWAYDGCDCECGGIPDADCFTKWQKLDNCQGTVNPICYLNVTTSLCAFPKSWGCQTINYNARDGCDCGCGAYDPDCDIPGQSLYSCQGTYDAFSCNYSGICVRKGCGNNYVDVNSAPTEARVLPLAPF